MTNLFQDFTTGSVGAFNSYYNQYNGIVYVFVKRLCGDDELAKDLTQEVFQKAWDRRANFNDEKHLSNYLFRVAGCLFLMHERERRKAVAAVSELRRVVQQDQDAVNANLVREEVFAAVQDALMKLPPQQKKVMELMIGGLDVKAVAKVLQLAPQTVRNHRAQALIFLRKELLLP